MKKSEFINNLKGFEYILMRESRKYRVAGMTYEDIAQEVRMRLWEKCILYSKDSSTFNTWATIVMKNCIKNLLRDAERYKRDALNNSVPLDENKNI